MPVLLEEGLSNFDSSIEEGLEEQLRLAPFQLQAPHHAWNFCGRVYFDGVQFVEEVHQFHKHVDTLKAPTLEKLMREVNDKWGWD